MKIYIRHSIEEWREPVETETSHHVAKLSRLLKSFAPDLVQLHGDVEKHPRRESYIFTINLSLPTGTLHATGEGARVRGGVKAAFSELEAQVKKHMALLRKDYQWRRRRPAARALA